ncbi:glycosyltransferase family 1 protein [Vibrio cholerae]|uniref:glycosyltransferase family 4 protein n=1 Tax=Vibrio cholerae TaxID=666 RepID=UPI00096BAE70|nr:glycosyltransferase family 4 protein [Vibrio cholerae]MBO1404912.1 glycosyltransferase family 1 protein [Vibrio cholerae]WOQ93352.1 glycosyltransferase family 4 protein [Vibrio cholerae]
MRVAIIGTVASSILGFRKDFIIELLSKGCVVFAFAIDYTDETRHSVEAMGATPVDYKFSRTGTNPFMDFWNTLLLARKLNEYRPDLVFSYFAKPVIFSTIAARIVKIPKCVGMLEGLGFIFTEHPNRVSLRIKIIRMIQVFLYRYSLPLLDNIIFLNHDDPIDLLKRYKINVKSYTVLGGIGVDLDRYHYQLVEKSRDRISFLFIGRLLAEKGINEYIEAAKIVKMNYPSVDFIILGAVDDNPGSLSKGQLEFLCQSGLINYPGHVSDVRDWIQKSSVFVLPSYYREGIPRSTQEAMAMGRAVITTDVPGCRETVIDGVNGFIVPAWSSEKIAEKMIYFINNPEKIVEMGINARKFAEIHYDVKKVNNRLIEILGINSGVVR